jgi:hypothetical protein
MIKTLKENVADIFKQDYNALYTANMIYELLKHDARVTKNRIDHTLYALKRDNLISTKTNYKKNVPAWYKGCEKLETVSFKKKKDLDAMDKLIIEQKRINIKPEKQVIYSNKYNQLCGDVDLIVAQQGRAVSATSVHSPRLTSRAKVQANSCDYGSF